MDKEQIKAIARSIWNIRREDEDRCDMEIEDLRESHSVFKEAEAAIESYKAELLKEVGEPVAWLERDLIHAYTPHQTGFFPNYRDKKGHGLFTSNQVAAAVLKATGPLEGEIERLKRQSANRLIGLCKGGEDNDELRAQLAAAQEENERLRIALGCTKRDLVRMRCPDFFEGVKDGYETLFDGHLVNMIGLINDYAKQK